MNLEIGKWICKSILDDINTFFYLCWSILFPGDYFVKLLKAKSFVRLSLVQNVSIVHHLHNIFFTHCLPQLLCSLLHLLQVNEPCQVIIVKIKYLKQSFRSLTISKSAINDLKKLFKIDGSVFHLEVSEQVEDDLVSFVKTQFLEDLLYLFGINLASSVFIEKVKGNLKLFKLLSGEPFANWYLFGLGLVGGNWFEFGH